LDWSYTLLSDQERRVLRRLSILPGNFSVERAAAIAAEAGEAKGDMVSQVISLVAKSLIAVSRCGSDTQLRLQSATRAYAAERLRESRDQGISKEAVSKEAMIAGRVRESSSTGKLIQH
jgi:predicted ATPase